MQSPGLSSAYAIVLDTTRMMQEKGFFTQAKENPVTTRKVVRFKEMDDQERVAYIKEHPLYGRVICRCETITVGEIVDALHRLMVSNVVVMREWDVAKVVSVDHVFKKSLRENWVFHKKKWSKIKRVHKFYLDVQKREVFNNA